MSLPEAFQGAGASSGYGVIEVSPGAPDSGCFSEDAVGGRCEGKRDRGRKKEKEKEREERGEEWIEI